MQTVGPWKLKPKNIITKGEKVMKRKMKNACRAVCFVLTLLFGVVAFASAQGMPTAVPEQVGLSSERLERIDKFIQTQMDNKEISGASVIVGRRGKVAYKKAFGLADIDAKKPMRTDTIFRLCSSSKMIGAVAGMIAWEDGLFDLYDPVSKYIPEVKDLKVMEVDPNDPSKYKIVPARTPMLMYQAFNFTAGMSYHLLLGFTHPALQKMFDDAPINDGYWPNTYTNVEWLKERVKLPLVNHPGEQFNYGRNLQVMTAVIEVITGMSFGEWCQKRIFDPLGMNDTHFFVPDEKMDRVASLYFKLDGKLVKAEEGKTYLGMEYGISEVIDPYWFRASKNPKKYYGAGESLLSTVEDYAKFLQMLVNGGELNGARILSPKTIEFMNAKHIKDWGVCKQLFDQYFAGYTWGLGWAVLEDVGVGHHIGTPIGKGKGPQITWNGWMGTRQYVDFEEELFVILMSQKLPAPQPWIDKLKDLVYQAIIE